LGKIRVLSGREVCAILASNGFAEVRRKGSHIAMQKRTANSTITVPVPDHREIRTGYLDVNHSPIGIAANALRKLTILSLVLIS
jgi:predicted RNA binding protein YcfA (HicA-like mRNA interferase family)